MITQSSFIRRFYLHGTLKKHLANIREKAGRHKTLIQNFSYLSALQVFNMLLPLITYPYLIRVLGKETYGLVVFAQAIVGYLVILVGFGFNISATKEISIHRDNREKLSEIVSSVLILKSGLFALSAIILVVLLLLIPQAKGYEALFLLMLWMCIYDTIFPVWYFQGIEQMKFITYITLISRLVSLTLIFTFIDTQSDYLYVPIVNGFGALIAGLVSLLIVFKFHRINLLIPTKHALIGYFKESIPIFISNVSIRLFISSNKVIVGSCLGMAEVAYYDLADKLIYVLKLPVNIFTQAIFPKITKEKNINLVKKIFNIYLIGNAGLLLLFLLTSRFVVLIVGGETMDNAVLISNILALSLPFVAISNVFGMQVLVPFGYEKTYSKSIVGSGIFYSLLVISIFIINRFSLINITVITLLTELFLATILFFQIKNKGLWKK